MCPGAFHITPGRVATIHHPSNLISIDNCSNGDDETVTTAREGDIEINNYYHSSSSCLIQAELVTKSCFWSGAQNPLQQQQIPAWNSIQQAQVIEPMEGHGSSSLDPDKESPLDDSSTMKTQPKQHPFHHFWNPGTKWVIFMICVTVVIAISCLTYLEKNHHETSPPCKPIFTKTVCYEIYHEKKKQERTTTIGISNKNSNNNITMDDDDDQVEARLVKEYNCLAPKFENKSICQVMLNEEHDASEYDLKQCRSSRSSLNETCHQIISAIQEWNVTLFDMDYTTDEALNFALNCTNATVLCEIIKDVIYDSNDDRNDNCNSRDP
jgi:hypothetical protein